jgi:transcription-repair coupling factor (superfamily II helicase)
VVTVNLDVPGEAHLPKDYVSADDARLEAYRHLAGVTTLDELTDLREEWQDRYGALPAPAEGLLELSELRLSCLELGVTSVSVLAAKVGVRTKPVIKLGPLELTLSQQMRLRRRLGSQAFSDTTKELRLEVDGADASPRAILTLLGELVAETSQ